MGKPRVFIGSSTEGLEFARAVRSLLAEDAEVTVWNEGFFGLGDAFIETLVNELPSFDFAVLIFTPDDSISGRESTYGPRDNVLFELGLFVGRLGRSRTFILRQSFAGLKIPTDLSGVTTAKFEWPRDDNSHKSAVGAACDSIREVIRSLGVSEAKTIKAIDHIRLQQERQGNRLDRQQAQIRSLQVALRGIVTGYELDKLLGLSKDGPFECTYTEDLCDEMRRLRAMDFVRNQEGLGLRDIIRDYRGRTTPFNLKKYFAITEQGIEYLNLRNSVL